MATGEIEVGGGPHGLATQGEVHCGGYIKRVALGTEWNGTRFSDENLSFAHCIEDRQSAKVTRNSR